MKKNYKKIIVSTALVASIAAVPALAFAAPVQAGGSFGGQMGGFGGQMGGFGGQMQSGSGFGMEMDGQQFGQQFGQMPGQMGTQSQQTASSPSTITASSNTSNSAESLTADTANATTIVVSESNSDIKIKESGTYIITGSASDGNITVKKGTTGVVLILKDLDLTSSTGATLSINKGSEVKVVVEGTVNLTDAEDIANEDSDDYDGAAIKVKAGATVALTGTGTLNVNGSCEHGIKVSDLDEDDVAEGYSEASLIIGGSIKLNVTAAEDGINSGTDLTIKSGTVTVSAGDDGIKSDYILTIGSEGSAGPTINVKNSAEGLEGAIVNIYSGQVTVNASDDSINAANSDLSGYEFSINIMGGTVNVSSGADGLDSNGNINITGGLTTIVKAASNGGEGGVDYEGSFYVAEGTFVNPYGITMDSGMGGQMGQPGQMNGQLPEMNGQAPEMNGQLPEMQDGEIPQLPEMQDGEMPQRPEMNDQQGGFGGRQMGPQSGQVPEMNGQAPETQNDSQLPQVDQNFFQKLVDTLQKFFSDFFKINKAAE